MEVSPAIQALGLACFAAAGLALGILYDLLRPARYFCRRGFFWDILFCALASATLFVLGMLNGRPGVWEVLTAGLAFCLYINYLSQYLLPQFLGTLRIMHKCSIFFLRAMNSLLFFVKKFFTNVQN